MCSSFNMKLILTLVLIVAASFCSSESQDLRDVVQGTFSTKLYMDVSSKSSNVIISQMSVKLVLALALLGAGGTTGSQITSALDLPQNRTRMESGFQDLMQLLQSNSDMNLTVANKLFMAENYVINPTFLSEAQQVFQSGAENLDFQNQPEASRLHINAWVEAQTNETIQNLIPQEAITQATVLVMVNTIFLNASWSHPFLARDTIQRPFRVTRTMTRPVKMMSAIHYMKYKKFDGYKAVEMACKGGVVSMLVLLPNAVNGLPGLEAKLKGQDWSQMFNNFSTVTVNLQIPKFKFENSWDLNGILKELGMTEMFSGNANFTGISEPSPVVTQVLQKAFIEVNEEGTVAAAATAIGMTVLEAIFPLNSLEFRADHPFMFMIRETSSGAVLFSGRVADPKQFSD